jgi:hypothetical protein
MSDGPDTQDMDSSNSDKPIWKVSGIMPREREWERPVALLDLSTGPSGLCISNSQLFDSGPVACLTRALMGNAV